MIVFIVPLRGKATSADWNRVSKLCERTIRSLCAQTSPIFRVVLVCSDRPDFEFHHPALTIVDECFPEVCGGQKSHQMLDKKRKVYRGLQEASGFAPCHVMKVDADDCVSKRLAEVVHGHPDVDAWWMEYGYMYEEGSRFVFKRGKFHLLCGSSHIVQCQPDELPRRDEPFAEGRYWISDTGHDSMKDRLFLRGGCVRPFPFPAVTYCVGNGENWSGATIRELLSWKSVRRALATILGARYLSRRLRRDFGLQLRFDV
jgi:hypothetical protein